jgi:hypothetical protein
MTFKLYEFWNMQEKIEGRPNSYSYPGHLPNPINVGVLTIEVSCPGEPLVTGAQHALVIHKLCEILEQGNPDAAPLRPA